MRPLLVGLGDHVMNIGHHLYANKLISYDIHEELYIHTKTSRQKARDIVNNVTWKVNANSEIFVEFIKVLEHNELPQLAKLLEDKFGECIKELLNITNI